MLDKEDRKRLNERFVQVFRLLESRGEIVKNDRHGKGVGDFAERILGKRHGHIIRAYLNPEDPRMIKYSEALKLCREYGVSEAYMLYGQGEPFESPLRRLARQSSGAEAASGGKILFTTQEAFAGDTIGVLATTAETNCFFHLPGIEGSGLVAFPIQGNSMEPVIYSGDIVICREVEEVREIRDNEIYAVKNNGSVWVKYVQRIFSGTRLTHLKLISANYLEYDPFEEEVNATTRLYRVIGKISRM